MYTPHQQPISHKQAAFTIVELLIVIVVIAILAAITALAYNGLQARAAGAALKSDLSQASKQLGLIHADEGNYPGDDSSLKKSTGTNFQYSGGGSSYCLTATSSRSGVPAYRVSNTGGVTEGVCPGHTAPGGGSGGGGTEIANNSPIQDITSAQCQALPTFTGSNNEAVRTVTDNRGGTTRTYEIAKLADGKCWMLTNLKLGSTSGTITLTPADSDVASNFTLPQLTTSGSPDYDNPRAYGPIPGDTGSGATNYGYFYNWSAATAGESRTSITPSISSGIAQHSICPAGWRLPTGGYYSYPRDSDFKHLDIALGGDGTYTFSSPSTAQWHYSGTYRGVLSGTWYGGFGAQGQHSALWSASAQLNDEYRASQASFQAGFVNPEGDMHRDVGSGVRCLLR
jgi:uncharacterized protein (TIGR02145 family)/prepilin-type N-terminal cleavage/methylation domain-containing protein